MTELLSRISTAPASPRSLNPEIPEALDRLVDQAACSRRRTPALRRPQSWSMRSIA